LERINFIDLTHKKEQHGLTYHPLYNVWREMRRRCDNPNHKWYPFYGGRGISVCKRWNTRFSNFYDDVIGLYKPNHVIDRVDNDGNYEFLFLLVMQIKETIVESKDLAVQGLKISIGGPELK